MSEFRHPNSEQQEDLSHHLDMTRPAVTKVDIKVLRKKIATLSTGWKFDDLVRKNLSIKKKILQIWNSIMMEMI